MSREIDEKVVEMEFNNSQFESNARESMSTLDKLKEKLNFSGILNGFSEIEEAISDVDFDPLNGGIEGASTRFSALEQIAIGALRNIGDRIATTGTNMLKSLSVDQITAGWSKYEQKTASVQTIMNSTGKTIDEVNQYLSKLMWYSDETSYGFTDMTQALGLMTSAGGDIDRLIPMIMGVANATAYAGRGASEFSRIMYNLNQSYAAGSLQLMDWKSVELAGAASKELKQTLIDTAVALGEIKEGQVNIANFNETLKNKWATTEVMETAFTKFSEMTEAAYQLVQAGQFDTASEAIAYLSGQYSDLAEKAFKSAQEAKSFTEAIEATKDAVSSGWLNTFEIIFGNYEEAKVLWTDLANILWDVFASGAEARNELLEGALTDSGRFVTKDDWYGLLKGNEYCVDLAEALKVTARQHGIAIDEMIGEEGTLFDTLESGWLTWDIFADYLNVVSDSAEPANVNLEALLDTYTQLSTQIIRGDFGNGADRVKALAEAGYDYATAQNIVNKVLKNETLTLEDVANVTGDLSDAQLLSAGYTQEQIDAIRALVETAEEAGTPLNELIERLSRPTGRELLFDSIYNAFLGFSKVAESVKAAWNETFEAITSEGIYQAIKSVNEFSQKLIMSDANAERLKNTFKGLFSVFEVIGDVVGNVIAIVGRAATIFDGLATVFLSITGLIGKLVFGFNDVIDSSEIVSTVGKGLYNVVGILADTFNLLAKGVAYVIDSFADFPIIEKFATAIGYVTTQIGEYFNRIILNVNNASDALLNFVFGSTAGLKEVSDASYDFSYYVGIAHDMIVKFFDAVSQSEGVKKLGEAFTALKNVLFGIISSIVGYIEQATDSFDELFGEYEWYEIVGGALVKVISGIAGALALMVSAITGSLSAVAESDLFEAVKEKFTELKASIFGGAEEDSKSGLSGVLSNIGNTLKNLFNDLTDALSKSDIKGSIKKFVTEMLESFKDLNTGVYEILKPAIQGIKDVLGGDEALVNIIGLIELYYVLKAIQGVANSMKPLGDISNSVVGLINGLTSSLKSLSTSVRIAAIGEALKDLGIAIGVISASIFALTFVDTSKLTGAVAVVGSLIISMGLLAKSMSDLKGVASTFSLVAFAASIDMLLVPVLALSLLDWNALLRGVSGVLALMAGLAASMAVLSNFAKDANKAALGLIAMAAAVDMLTVPVLAMALIPYQNLEQGLGATITLMGALTIASMVMGETTPKMIAGSVAMIGMAVAVDLLALALVPLSLLDSNKLATATFSVASLIAVLAIASPSLALFATGCGAMAAGLGVLVVSIPIALAALASAIKGFREVKELNVTVDDLATGLIALGVAITVTAVFLPVLSKLGKALLSIGGGIAAAAAGIAAFGVITVLFSKFAQDIAAGAEALILTLCKVIQNTGPVIIETVIGLIDALLESLANHAYTIVISLIHILAEIFAALKDIIIAGLGDLGHSIMSFFGLEGTFFDQMFVSWNTGGNKSVSEHYANGVRDGASSTNLGNAVQGVTDTVSTTLEAGGDELEDAGLDNIQSYADGYEDNSVLRALNKISGAIPVSEVKEMAKANGLFGDLSDDQIDEMLDEWGVADKLLGSTATKEIQAAATTATKKTAGTWATVSEDAIQGIIRGLQSENPALQRAAINMIKRLLGATQDAAEINSPSVLFKEEVGEYIVQGIAEGIEKDMSAEEAAEQKASNIVSAFQKELDKLDLTIDIADLEYEIWAAAYEDPTEAADYFSRTSENLTKKLEASNQKLNLARDEYNATLKEFGETSEYTREAYLKMLQAELEVKQLQHEIDQLSVEQFEKMQEDLEKRLDSINLRIDVYDKEAKLLSSMFDGADESITKYSTANTSLKKYTKNLEAARVAQEKYNNAVKRFGKDSDEALEAYEDLLDIQTDMVDLVGEFGEALGLPDVAVSLMKNVTAAYASLQNNPQLQAVVTRVGKYLTGLVGEEAAQGITNGVQMFFKGGGTNILTNALMLGTSIAQGDAASAITASFQLVGSLCGTEFGQAILSTVGSILTKGENGGLLGVLKNGLSKVAQAFTGGSGGISGIVGSIGTKIGNWISSATGTAMGEGGSGGGLLGVLKSVIAAVASKLNVSGIFEIISGIGSTIGNWLLKALSGVLGGAGGILDIIKNILSGVGSFFSGGAGSGGSGVLGTIVNVGKNVGSALISGVQAVAGAGASGGGVIGTVGSILSGIAGVAGKGMAAVGSAIGGAVSTVTGAVGGLGAGLAGLASSAGPIGLAIAGGAALTTALGSLSDKFHANKIAAEQSGSSLKAFAWGAAEAVAKVAEFMNPVGMIKKGVEVGSNLISGLWNGVKSVAGTVVNGVKNVASSIWGGIKSFFGIHSPSTLMFSAGQYVMQGLELGISAFGPDVVNAISNNNSTISGMMESLVDRIRSLTQESLDVNPVITPVVDATNVEETARDINSLFANGQTLGLATSIRKAASALATQVQNQTIGSKDGAATGSVSQLVFNQYNTSPKALSSVDIYRQTRNQFAQMKELVQK